MRGPSLTLEHVIKDGGAGEYHVVEPVFHCRMDCPHYAPDGRMRCERRDWRNPALCGHVPAQVEALKYAAARLAALAERMAELERDAFKGTWQ